MLHKPIEEWHRFLIWNERQLRMKPFSLIIVLVIVSACSTAPNQNQETLPLMAPTGNVTASEFVSIFAKICLANFPNNDAIVAVFRDNGFSVKSAPKDDFEANFYRFSSQHSAILGSAGSSILWWSGSDGGGAEAYQFCEVETELINPETIDDELAGQILSQGGDLIINDQIDTNDRQSGHYENLEGNFRFSFEQRKLRASSPALCNGLEECRRWGKATLRIDTLL